MSVTAPPTHATNGLPTTTAAELVRSLPEAFRRDVLCELLRNLSADGGQTGVIPVRDTADRWIANVVLPHTPGAKADQIFFEFDPAFRTMLMQGYIDLDLDDTYTPDEMTAAVRAGASPTPQEQSLPPTHRDVSRRNAPTRPT